MALYNQLYGAVDVLLALSSFLILYFACRGGSLGEGRKEFVLFTTSMVIYILSDGVAVWVDGVANARIFKYILDVLFFTSSAFLGIDWFGYAWLRLGKKRTKLSDVLTWVSFGGGLAIFVLSVLSYWWPILFHLDENGVYSQGRRSSISRRFSTFFWCFLASGLALDLARKEENKFRRKRNYLLAIFPICPVIAAILQTFFPGLPLISFGLFFAYLFFFATAESYHYSLDELTGLYNRNLLAHTLRSYARRSDSKKPAYLVIADVDFLKKINDTYGHLAGDQAIVTVAGVLKNAISARDFCCRYGGDEFMLIVHPSSPEEILALQRKIQALIEEDNAKRGPTSFHLSLSFGFTPLEEGVLPEESYIKKADILLYQSKNKREK
jgi:diguanylate cyclase (GGDEF)-like protein